MMLSAQKPKSYFEVAREKDYLISVSMYLHSVTAQDLYLGRSSLIPRLSTQLLSLGEPGNEAKVDQYYVLRNAIMD